MFSEGFHVRYDVQAQKKAEERLMQSKPKAYVFLEEFLEKAGIRKGHQPGYIKELYPGIA